MNIEVDKDKERAVGLVKVRAQEFQRLSSSEFWKNIHCLVLDPTFSLGG